MNPKKILLVIFSLLMTVTYAQSESDSLESQISVTELKFETDNIEELINFDWNTIKDMFQETDNNAKITLSFVYENKPEADTTEVRVNNFKMKFTGKRAELDKLIERMKKSFKKLDKITEQGHKN